MTFIRAHNELPRRKQRGIRYRITDFFDAASGGEFNPCWIEFLTAKVVVLYGRYFRTAGEGGEIVAGGIGGSDKPLLSLTRRLQRKIAHRVLRFSNNRYERNALARFLVENKVDAVLAEYGPAGVAAMDACNAANVPLSAHFHGNDDYAYARLERKEYPELFHYAASVVTVSRDMEKRLLTLGAPRGRSFL